MRTQRADANTVIAVVYAQHQKHAADIRALPVCEAKAFFDLKRDRPIAAAFIRNKRRSPELLRKVRIS